VRRRISGRRDKISKRKKKHWKPKVRRGATGQNVRIKLGGKIKKKVGLLAKKIAKTKKKKLIRERTQCIL